MTSTCPASMNLLQPGHYFKSDRESIFSTFLSIKEICSGIMQVIMSHHCPAWSKILGMAQLWTPFSWAKSKWSWHSQKGLQFNSWGAFLVPSSRSKSLSELLWPTFSHYIICGFALWDRYNAFHMKRIWHKKITLINEEPMQISWDKGWRGNIATYLPPVNCIEWFSVCITILFLSFWVLKKQGFNNWCVS